MDHQAFRIPKQTDEAIIAALTIIRNEIAKWCPLSVQVTPHEGAPTIDIPDPEPVNAPAISYIVSQRSEIMPRLYLRQRVPNGQTAVIVTRVPTEITDEVKVHWQEWAAQLPQEIRSQAYVTAQALARQHLHAPEVVAQLSGTHQNEWGRYRDSQQLILDSLQQTSKSVLVEIIRRSADAEAAAKAKYAKLEEELRAEVRASNERLTAEHDQKLKAIEEREAIVKKSQETFNTKEGRYVARQEQQKQIEQIKGWLEGWSLTTGTTKKQRFVTNIYVFAAVIMLGITIWFSTESFNLLKGNDVTKLAWWQWALLSLKSIVPLAAFTTFIIYLIRWASVWSRQHAEEEFRNRARILDIGRCAWLLEAVRDAQDNQKELPADLLKELSRNLFNPATATDGADLYPDAISDLLMQGLSSLRVKTHDGTEVEATRGKKA